MDVRHCFFLHEQQQHHGVSTKHATLPGINFPVDDDALAKLEQIKSKEISYVQLVS